MLWHSNHYKNNKLLLFDACTLSFLPVQCVWSSNAPKNKHPSFVSAEAVHSFPYHVVSRDVSHPLLVIVDTHTGVSNSFVWRATTRQYTLSNSRRMAHTCWQQAPTARSSSGIYRVLLRVCILSTKSARAHTHVHNTRTITHTYTHKDMDQVPTASH